MLPGYFETGLLNGHSLVMLEHIISQVINQRWGQLLLKVMNYITITLQFLHYHYHYHYTHFGKVIIIITITLEM